ncbi:hypothetical protein F4777DRAFT_530483 [Nemania sp. FL0916]|nr:hypothetical protein F4777DRAFT_530483 [Nemania sp. FL0916]
MGTSHLGLEIPAFGGSAAASAHKLGARRIEINAEGSYGAGGLTPTIDDLKTFTPSDGRSMPARRVMIRPRGPLEEPSSSSAAGARDFLYSEEEFEIMRASIRSFKRSDLLDADKGDGFVFGILEETASPDGKNGVRFQVDEKRCSQLVDAAQPFKCVFHRAFDEIVSCDDTDYDGASSRSWETGLQAIAECGFDGILTSGGLGRAIDNVKMLERIIQKAEDLGIEIIIGGGVRMGNVAELIRRLKLQERADAVFLHSACLRGDGSENINEEEVQGIIAHANSS